MSAITRFTGDLEPLKYLDYTTAAIPYHLLDDPEVLVLGVGGGEQVLLALFHEAPEIDAVDSTRKSAISSPRTTMISPAASTIARRCMCISARGAAS